MDIHSLINLADGAWASLLITRYITFALTTGKKA
jgi:hypothetical protein